MSKHINHTEHVQQQVTGTIVSKLSIGELNVLLSFIDHCYPLFRDSLECCRHC